jgi:hypothetical protein
VATGKRVAHDARRTSSAIISENEFHSVHFGYDMLTIWQMDLPELENLLSATMSPNGVDERTLLDWFGSSVERITLLAYALHGIMPTHVARELRIGNFRTDFAWAEVAPEVDSTVGLIELEDCKPTTLFAHYPKRGWLGGMPTSTLGMAQAF